MTRRLQVNNQEFDYPEQGDINWGEDATEWAVSVTDALSDIVGPQDILLREAPLTVNQLTQANINGLVFDTSAVQQVFVDGIILRDTSDGLFSESFFIEGNYDGSQFILSNRSVGSDCGVVIDALSSGQFVYTSNSDSTFSAENAISPATTTISFKIKFRARTIIDA
jgi:hypothetical protein